MCATVRSILFKIADLDPFFLRLAVRYGGVDSVLLWHSYPNIGVDDRSQFDMLRSLPGGVPGVKALVDAFHAEGVQVILPYNPWDTGTNRSGHTDVVELIDLIQSVDADGFNGDTVFGLGKTFYSESVTNGGKAVALQPECSTDNRNMLFDNGTRAPYYGTGRTLAYNPLSWGYWGYLPPGKYPCSNCSDSEGAVDWSVPMSSNFAGVGPPLVSRNRAIDSRHMAQVCERWAVERTDGLQHAFVNGAGYAPWESIWGIWNPLSEGDGEALRRTMHVIKYFASSVMGGTFDPMVAVASEPGVFCSRFDATLYTCINRRGSNDPASASTATSRLPNNTAHLTLACNSAAATTTAFWDVWNGVKLQSCAAGQTTVTVPVPMHPRSFGAVALVSDAAAASTEFASFLQARRQFAKTPLNQLSYRTQPLQQTLVPSVASPNPFVPTNTTLVKADAGLYNFVVHGVQVEGAGGLAGPDARSQPDVQFPWEDEPSRMHAHALDVPDFHLDTYPVTNARYHAFIHATAYSPSAAETEQNYLRHWAGRGDQRAPQPGTEQQPVRWVSREDAQAFCQSEGKRLPHTWEWQFAAQGYDERVYPWGNTFDTDAIPVRNRNTTMGEPADVGTHPKGAAANGIQDLVGVIWQMADNFCDDHTCRAIVRGSGWCVGPQLCAFIAFFWERLCDACVWTSKKARTRACVRARKRERERKRGGGRKLSFTTNHRHPHTLDESAGGAGAQVSTYP